MNWLVYCVSASPVCLVDPLHSCPCRHNDNKTFLVWVNEEDHLRVISMQQGGNMREVFKRFCTGLLKVHIKPWHKWVKAVWIVSGCPPWLSLFLIRQIEEIFKKHNHGFMWNEHLGYILTCPSNLGTGLRGGVHVKLPKLSTHAKFEEILTRLRLQKRGTGTNVFTYWLVGDLRRNTTPFLTCSPSPSSRSNECMGNVLVEQVNLYSLTHWSVI